MAYKINDNEFVNLFWDIHRLSGEIDLRKKYEREFKDIFPHLTRTSHKETNKMVRYVIYMYDINSPLRKHIKNIDDRKDYAAQLAGYGKTSEDPSKKERVVKATDTQVSQTIFCFIKNIDNLSYAQLVLNETTFWSYYKELMVEKSNPTSSDLKIKKELRAELKVIQEDIDSLTFTLFGGDKEAAEIIKQMRKMQTTPEHMAMKI